MLMRKANFNSFTKITLFEHAENVRCDAAGGKVPV